MCLWQHFANQVKFVDGNRRKASPDGIIGKGTSLVKLYDFSKVVATFNLGGWPPPGMSE